MKVKFPDVWYKEKSQAAFRLSTFLRLNVIVLHGFKSLESDNAKRTKVYNAIGEIAAMKNSGYKAFLEIAARYDDETIYGSEGALNLILGIQRALGERTNEGLDDFINRHPYDLGDRKDTQVEIFLIPDDQSQGESQKKAAQNLSREEVDPEYVSRRSPKMIEPEPEFEPVAKPKPKPGEIEEE
jgi:hypothetical protein